MMFRRDFLMGSLALAGAGVLPRHALAAGEMSNPLKIPPLIEGRGGAEKTFELGIQAGKSSFLPGLSTPTYGINGPYLGPTIRVRNGERVVMQVRNGLDEPTTLHWHGLHVPANCDGGPHQVIEPGKIWDPSFTIKQHRASLCWYHSHLEEATGEQVLRGLAGLFLIEDEESGALKLPSEYGVDDIPLILQDRRFADDGSFEYIRHMGDVELGFIGDTMLVNGTVSPHLVLRRARTRLRILNGSNARIYNLGWSDGSDLIAIGADGSLLGRPERLSRVRLGPGERIEILVEMKPDSRVTLMSYPEAARGMMMPGMGGMRGMPGMGRMSAMTGGDETLRILELRAAKLDDAASPLPDRLIQVPQWKAEQAARTRRFTLDMSMMRMGPMIGPTMERSMGINGRSMDMHRIDERVPLDSIEIWEIENRTPLTHPFHIHDIQFRVLDRDGAAPQPHELGLKDTVLVDPASTVRVIAQFSDFADPDHPYMYHCHILEHEDAGMMGQFVVV